jgi:type VI secretion system secreted protein Hcp
MAIYMKIEGSKKIEGPVTIKNFEKHIELRSFDLGAHRSASIASKSEQKRTHAEASLTEIIVRKWWDATSSPKLFEAVLNGTADYKVTVTFTSADESGPLTFLVIELEKVVFSDYHINASSGGQGGQPDESLSINYTKITVSPSTVNADNKPSNGARVSHDMTTGVTG